MRARGAAAWAAFSGSAAAGLAGLVLLLASLGAPVGTPWGFRGAIGLWGVVFGLVGLVLALRVGANPIGWVLLAAGALSAALFLAQETAAFTYAAGDVWEAAAWLPIWGWIPTVGLLSVALLLFPDGRLPNRRWRWLLVAVAVSTVVLSAVQAMYPWTDDTGYGFSGNPYVQDTVAAIGTTGHSLLAAVFQLTTVIAVISPVARRRRADVVTRLQLRWLAYVVVVVAVLVVGNETGYALKRVSPEVYRAGSMLLAAAIPLVPVAMGVAVLRYRLYEIDRIISRTVAYAILLVVLGGAFVGLVIGVQQLARPVTGGDDLAVAVSTLAIAAVFQPLRSRVRRAVDRWFNRSGYDRARIVEAFGARLRDAVDLASVTGSVEDVVGRALQPSHLSIWLVPERAAAHGSVAGGQA